MRPVEYRDDISSSIRNPCRRKRHGVKHRRGALAWRHSMRMRKVEKYKTSVILTQPRGISGAPWIHSQVAALAQSSGVTTLRMIYVLLRHSRRWSPSDGHSRRTTCAVVVPGWYGAKMRRPWLWSIAHPYSRRPLRRSVRILEWRNGHCRITMTRNRHGDKDVLMTWPYFGQLSWHISTGLKRKTSETGK